MFVYAQGIPGLTDLTHPKELMEFGAQLLKISLLFALLVAGLGVVIALLNFSLRSTELELAIFVREWVPRYSILLRSLSHIALTMIILVTGFFLCTTLANRYHYWEQAKVAKVAESVAGSLLSQASPQIRYVVDKPYNYTDWIDGKQVVLKKIQQVDFFLFLNSSNIEVKIERRRNLQNRSYNYDVNFVGDYQVVNPLPSKRELFFDVSEPYGYSLLQSFRVEKDGNQLKLSEPGKYSFPFALEPGKSTNFRISYQAQGGQRWVYSAEEQLLSNFRLNIAANFPQADFAGGILPSYTKVEGKSTVFTWVFKDNVSVRHPFGVFTATEPLRNTGIISRLLLLAPGLFLWWLLLLYLSIPMTLRNVAIVGGLFFACLLALTYFSRVMDKGLAWTGISLILLSVVWGLGTSGRDSSAAVLCTITGAILPVLGLLIPQTGLTLSLAGLLSAVWLAIRNWYID